MSKNRSVPLMESKFAFNKRLVRIEISKDLVSEGKYEKYRFIERLSRLFENR